MIEAPMRSRLYEYMAGIVRNHDGHLIRAGGTPDHVHLLIELDASTSVAGAVRVIKANTSKWIHETFPDQSGFAWQAGYAAFTVSESAIPRVTRYIDGQEEHHRRKTFTEEFREFLQRHKLEFDERHRGD